MAAEPNATRQPFATNVATFEDGIDHPSTDIIYALDPSAFQLQDSPGIDAVGEGFGGAYLVPDDFLGYLATGLDYFLLSPTGLDYLLARLSRSCWAVRSEPNQGCITARPVLISARDKPPLEGGRLDRWGHRGGSPPVQTPNVEPAAVNPGAPGVR